MATISPERLRVQPAASCPSTPSSLRVAYEDDAGEWRSLQVDFVFVSRHDNGTLAASLVDPHGDHLADARAKLLALADYAERFGERYVRIDSIAKSANGTLRCLSLTEANVRQAVRDFAGGKVSALYDSPVAHDYL